MSSVLLFQSYVVSLIPIDDNSIKTKRGKIQQTTKFDTHQ